MAPALRVPVSVNVAEFEKQMSRMGDITTRVAKQLRNEIIKVNAELAVQGVKAVGLFGAAFTKQFIKAAYEAGLLGAALRNVVKVATPIALVVGSFEAVAAITEFAKGKIEEFVKIQEKAAAVGVTADFFQRWVKGAEDLKIKIEEATAILEKFAETTRNKLGGSDIQKRIVELQEAGNLKGISTAGFEGAIGTTEKLEEMNKILKQMLDSGERLAALDLAEKMGGKRLAENMATNAGYLDRILEAAKNVEATRLVNQDDINRAVDLTNRLEAAQKLLEEKWVPLQRLILKMGLDYNESWINFYNNLATVISGATSLLNVLDKIGAKLNEMGASSAWDKMLRAAAAGIPIIGPAVSGIAGIVTGGGVTGRPIGGTEEPLSAAKKALGSGLKNQAVMDEWTRLGSEIQSQRRGDTSKPPGQAKPAAGGGAETDFLAQQNTQIEKHIDLMNADAAAVGLGAGKREELRTVSLLMTAAEKDGVTVTEELKMAMQALGEQAGQAAEKLAQAQHRLQEINQLGQTLGSALSTAFADAVLEGKKLNEVLSQMLKTLARAAINWAIMAPFQPGAGGGASLFAGLFGMGKAGGTDYAQGGMTLVGEQGRELVNIPRGSQIIPADVTRNMMGGSGTVVYSPAIDARGASVEAVARLAQIMEQDRAMFASRTIATIQQARRGRVAGL